MIISIYSNTYVIKISLDNVDITGKTFQIIETLLSAEISGTKNVLYFPGNLLVISMKTQWKKKGACTSPIASWTAEAMYSLCEEYANHLSLIQAENLKKTGLKKKKTLLKSKLRAHHHLDVADTMVTCYCCGVILSYRTQAHAHFLI